LWNAIDRGVQEWMSGDGTPFIGDFANLLGDIPPTVIQDIRHVFHQNGERMEHGNIA
jgi:hypothetical protein